MTVINPTAGAGTAFQTALLALPSPLSIYPFNELAGPTAADIVNARNGTYAGQFTLNQSSLLPSHEGRAVLLNPSLTTGRIEVAPYPVAVVDEWSVVVWIEPGNLTPTEQFVIDGKNEEKGTFIRYNNLGVVRAFVGKGAEAGTLAELVSPAVLTIGAPALIILTVTKTTAKLYVNSAVPAQEKAFAINSPALNGGTVKNLRWGQRLDGLKPMLAGQLQYGSIFGAPLTTKQIEDLITASNAAGAKPWPLGKPSIVNA